MGADQSVISFWPYQEDLHFGEICRWLDARNKPLASAEDLSSGHGYMAYDNEGPLAACFLYKVGTLGFIEALVIRPGTGIAKSRDVSTQLFEMMKTTAQHWDITRLVAFVASKGMVKECGRRGFEQVGPPMAQMVHSI